MSFLRTHLRWGVVALLFFTALLNNLDRMVLSVLAPTLKESLSFGDVEYSYVVAAFLAAYALGYTFCGKVLDRVGVKLGMMAALVFWSVAAMGHAAAVGWLSLAAFRFLLGLGESFNSPGGVRRSPSGSRAASADSAWRCSRTATCSAPSSRRRLWRSFRSTSAGGGPSASRAGWGSCCGPCGGTCTIRPRTIPV